MPTIETKAVAVLEKKAAPIFTTATALKIESAKDQAVAAEMLAQIESYADKMDALKKTITKPANEVLKAARTLFKPFEEKSEEASSYLRKEMGRYQLAMENAAKEEEARIAARVGEGKGKLKAETAVRKFEEIERPEAAVATSLGAIKFRTDKKLKIVNPEAIQMWIIKNKYFGFCAVNESALLKYLKEGNTVDGAELEEVKTPINIR